MLSLLSKIINPKHTSQCKLVKDTNSNKANDRLIGKAIQVTLFDNLLTCRDTGKKFQLQGDPSKVITNKNYTLDLANLLDKNLMFECAEELYFDERASGFESTRNKSLIKLPKSPGILAFGISTRFLIF